MNCKAVFTRNYKVIKINNTQRGRKIQLPNTPGKENFQMATLYTDCIFILPNMLFNKNYDLIWRDGLLHLLSPI